MDNQCLVKPARQGSWVVGYTTFSGVTREGPYVALDIWATHEMLAFAVRWVVY